jgi:hypothetical protein
METYSRIVFKGYPGGSGERIIDPHTPYPIHFDHYENFVNQCDECKVQVNEICNRIGRLPPEAYSAYMLNHGGHRQLSPWDNLTRRYEEQYHCKFP